MIPGQGLSTALHHQTHRVDLGMFRHSLWTLAAGLFFYIISTANLPIRRCEMLVMAWVSKFGTKLQRLAPSVSPGVYHFKFKGAEYD
ncbi:hypothetical protein F5Y09DRAFT_348959 [Xylaria sp. FL1042]|nr:hypothetical protein F5Y09DRAFT_348959 [Xylaria sp. FL1042]